MGFCSRAAWRCGAQRRTRHPVHRLDVHLSRRDQLAFHAAKITRGSTRTTVSKTSMVVAALLILATTLAAVFLIRLLGERYGYAERFQRSNATQMVSATVTWSAIKESPFIGYGSWPRDPEFAPLRDELVTKAKGVKAFRTTAQDDLIIAHSQILQGWLEGGLLGLTFFACLAWLLFRQLAWLILASPFTSLTPLIAFLQLMSA